MAYVWAKAAKKIVIYRAKIYNYFLHIKIDESDIDYENIVMLRMRQELTKDNPMEEMFFDSLVDRRQIMITLQNKKIYIGIINALGEPNEKEGPNQYISILPILSGYRHKDDLNIVLKNEYVDLNNADTSIILPLKEITQVSWFDAKIYKQVENSNVS
ncbi:hypothetical protein WH390_07275 [Candidatus Arsenophonus nilaparvatae]|uniref:hypothetical protein n=1 Tax=Candidatus Arsenophonus nilaparvatae TaxID=1247023 RepID=UPI001EE69DE3|nr:hypothetical protein [Candidatus Arsenophonus nilaparvatae]